MTRSVLRWVLRWAVVLTGLAVLAGAGHGPLGPPAGWTPTAFGRWIAADGVPVATLAGLRLASMVAGVYLACLLALADMSRLPGIGRVVRPLLRVPFPGRRLVLRVAGVAWVATVTVGPTAWAVPPAGGLSAPVSGVIATAGDDGAPTMTWLGPPDASSLPPAASPPAPASVPQPASPPAPVSGSPSASPPASPSASPPASPPAPVSTPMTVVVPAAGPGVPAQPVPDGPSGVLVLPAGTPAAVASDAGSHGVAPSAPVAPVPGAPYSLVRGDHLWSVAARTLEHALGGPQPVTTIGPYWERLVEANRARLPVPSEPDYVVPGLVVQLPPLA